METAQAQEEFFTTAERSQVLAAFEEEIAGAHILGEWQVRRRKEHGAGGVPYLWERDALRALLRRGCEVLSLDMGARRSLLFLNPGIPHQGTTLALRAGVQIMNPHEQGLAHRHKINALRFVIEGSPDAFTVVNGEKLVMNDYDLILTPQPCWHHHENHGDHEVLWMDAVDAPLLTFLNVYFFQPHPDGRPPVMDDARSVRHRVGTVRPTWQPLGFDASVGVPVVYPWSEVEPRLRALAGSEGDPCDGILLEYKNPVTGGPALSTIDCHVQMLRPGEATKAHRHTSGCVYHVIAGQGVTRAGEVELRWKKGDHFVIPNWCWHEHRNASDRDEALLFSVSDAPILRALCLYQEETR